MACGFDGIYGVESVVWEAQVLQTGVSTSFEK
jgi:hypothetical protein